MEAFTSLLLEMEITSTSKWGEVNRLCNQDPRWAALKTMGQKKQFFAEWQTRRMKEEKEERRLNLKKARDKFLKMLAEDTTIDMKTRWREAQTRLLDDERYEKHSFDQYQHLLRRRGMRGARATKNLSSGHQTSNTRSHSPMRTGTNSWRTTVSERSCSTTSWSSSHGRTTRRSGCCAKCASTPTWCS